MNDYSYEILDLLKKYNNDIDAALAGETCPQCLYAFSPLRENLFEWVEIGPEARVLQIGSDYGSYTGLLAERSGEVVVLDPRDENLEVNRIRHGARENVIFVRGDILSNVHQVKAMVEQMKTENPDNGAVSAIVRSEENYKIYKPKETKALAQNADGNAEKIDGAGTERTIKDIMYKGFDYVILGGYLTSCKKEDAAEILREAANYLKPCGVMLAAVENETGVRYWMGAEKFETMFLESEFRGLFTELTNTWGGHFTMYYPVPDYRYPVSVYSDHYLPGAGDVTNISARYDGPGFWFGSEEEAMAKACQNGDFTKFNNSFLGVWEKGSL